MSTRTGSEVAGSDLDTAGTIGKTTVAVVQVRKTETEVHSRTESVQETKRLNRIGGGTTVVVAEARKGAPTWRRLEELLGGVPTGVDEQVAAPLADEAAGVATGKRGTAMKRGADLFDDIGKTDGIG